MSVDLPPPQAPLAVSAAQIPQNDNPYSTRFLAKPLLVRRAPLTPEEIEQALAGATELEMALRQLAAACQAKGYPAAQLLYAPGRDAVQVLFVPGKVARVLAVEPLKPYFEPLAGKSPLLDRDFEPARVLAGLHAERTGISSVPHFRGDTLEVNADSAQKPYALSLQFDNDGTRFVGRHFAELEGSLGFDSGDEVHASMREGLQGLNSEATASSYHRPALGWSRVMPAGMLSVDASHARYEYEQVGQPLTGNTARVEASWLQMLHADYNRRWTAELKADYTASKVERQADGRQLRDESYPSLQVESTYASSIGMFGKALKSETTITVRKGLGRNEDAGGGGGLFADPQYPTASRDYLLVQPALGFTWAWSETLQTKLDISSQLSKDILPEQEEFFLGGSDSMTAWLPGIVTGDNGYFVRLQTAWTHEWQSATLRPSLFVEHGGARYQEATAGVGSSAQMLTDAGAELVMEWSERLEAAIAYAVPLEDKGVPQDLLDRYEAGFCFRIKMKL